VVEDISVVANYRSQFNRILANGSFDELIKRLKEKESNHKD
jgi:phospholipid transport system substrate-binding protein